MLHNSGVVGHAVQMIQCYGWKSVKVLHRVPSRKCGTRFSQTFVVHALEASHVLLRDAVPNHVSRIQVGTLPHRMPPGSVVQKLDRFCGNRLRIIERDKRSAFVSEQFNCMQIWR